MEGLVAFLIELKQLQISAGNFLGLLQVLIGRRIRRANAAVISNGVTWRELAAAFKKARWPKEQAQELGLNLAELPQRDRQQFWYAVIARANVDSLAATAAGNELAEVLKQRG